MITAIIVVYNKSLKDSPTCIFAKENKLPTIICDNSERENENEKTAVESGFTYIFMNGNKGLSKAYNKALEIKSEAEYYLILDDDTILPENFISEIFAHIKENPDADILLPKIFSGEMQISPAVLGNVRVRSIRKGEKVKTFTAINSGMVIKKSFFDDFRYEENLFLDYIDHDLMCYANNKDKKIHIMEDVLITQNFFGLSETSEESKKRRYNIFKHDFSYFVKKHKRNKFIAALIILKRRLAAGGKIK
jgi:GT2 family glycosyltransferase